MMELRPVQPTDDRLAISRIYAASWRYAYREILPADYLASIPDDRWAQTIDRPGMQSLLLEEDGVLLGTTGFCPSRWPERADWGEIVSLYLVPETMGKGYGIRLLHGAMDALSGMGFSDLLLWVLEENARARRFYEKAGFRCSDARMEQEIGGRVVREVQYTYHRTGTR